MRGEVVQLRLSSAKVSRKSTPCTNLPMLCKFCEQPQYVWKYGMADHVAAEHKFKLLQNDDDMQAFAQEYTVSEEEKRLVLAAFKMSSKPKSGGGRGRPRKTAHKTARRLIGNQQHGRRQPETGAGIEVGSTGSSVDDTAGVRTRMRMRTRRARRKKQKRRRKKRER